MSKVIFRKFKNGNVIALFPDIPADHNGNIMSYGVVGQHGPASPELIKDLEEVYSSEWRYKELKQELIDIGYNLERV